MRQHAEPVIVNGVSLLQPTRIHFTDSHMVESWLQELLYSHPELLPVQEIEPAFTPLIPLCRELSMEAGPVDPVCCSPDGLITIVETKLWRNPQARREVVAQTIDYASAIQGWDYDELEEAVARARVEPSFSLFRHVSLHSPEEALTEPEFVDGLSRSLQRARFLLIIAGDGIREGAERMAAFLTNPQMHYTLALCEIACYQLPEGILVIPRTTARTHEVERAVVRIVRDEASGIDLDISFRAVATPPAHSRRRLSTEAFFAALEDATNAEVVQAVEQIVEQVTEEGVLVRTGSGSLIARLPDPADSGSLYSLFVITHGGEVYSDWLPGQLTSNGLSEEIGRDHFRRLRRVVGHEVDQEEKPLFGKQPKVQVSALIGKEDDFVGAVLQTVRAIREARQAAP